MAKLSPQEYRNRCEKLLVQLAFDPQYTQLSGGVFYRELQPNSRAVSGHEAKTPTTSDVVCVHYTGRLINDVEFDTTRGGYPETFRVREVIEGWQIALQQMQVGDHWEIYIPHTVGYGPKRNGKIPGSSTLIFEVELLSIN